MFDPQHFKSQEVQLIIRTDLLVPIFLPATPNWPSFQQDDFMKKFNLYVFDLFCIS